MIDRQAEKAAKRAKQDQERKARMVVHNGTSSPASRVMSVRFDKSDTNNDSSGNVELVEQEINVFDELNAQREKTHEEIMADFIVRQRRGA